MDNDTPQKPSGNPRRANGGRYCTGAGVKPVGRTIGSAVKYQNVIPKDKNSTIKMTKSGLLTELRKQAKALGIEKVNTLKEEELRGLIAAAKASKKTAKNTEATVEALEKVEAVVAAPELDLPEAPAPEPKPDKDEKAALKEELAMLGGQVPRGNVGVAKLKKLIAEAKK